MILARYVDFDVTPTSVLPWLPDIQFSLKFNFTFSTIFLVNNGHRAIKVNVNEVQYCRAGDLMIPSVAQGYEDTINSIYVRLYFQFYSLKYNHTL